MLSLVRAKYKALKGAARLAEYMTFGITSLAANTSATTKQRLIDKSENCVNAKLP